MDRRRLDLDRRSTEYRRYEEIRNALVADQGGEDAVSTAVLQITEKTAFIAMTLEAMQMAALSGEDVDYERYGRLFERMRRGLDTIGLERRARDITPVTVESLKAKWAAQAHPFGGKDKTTPQAGEDVG